MKEVEKEEIYSQPDEDFTIGKEGVIRMGGGNKDAQDERPVLLGSACTIGLQ